MTDATVTLPALKPNQYRSVVHTVDGNVHYGTFNEVDPDDLEVMKDALKHLSTGKMTHFCLENEHGDWTSFRIEHVVAITLEKSRA